MKTVHINNRAKISQSIILKLIGIMIGLALVLLFFMAPSLDTALISLVTAVVAIAMTYHIMRKAYNGFTLTSTHI